MLIFPQNIQFNRLLIYFPKYVIKVIDLVLTPRLL